MFNVTKALGFDISSLNVLKGAGDGGPSEIGEFTGYASTYGNADRDGDVVMPGAFAADIDARKVKMLRQHKHTDLIGVWKAIKSDHHGLLVTGQINLDVQLGRETYSLMKQGALDSMSVGMGVPRDQYEEKELPIDGTSGRKRKVRHIKKAFLNEISLVSIPANPAALITSVKADGEDAVRIPTIREFETILREADWSRKERAEASREYVALMKKWGVLRDADTEDDLVRDAEDQAAKAARDAEAAKSKAEADAIAIRKAIAEAFGTVLAGA